MTKNTAYEYIDSDTSLESLINTLKDEPRVALDTEANSLHNYFDRVCLIQLSCKGHHFIIDPLAKCDFVPFINWLQDRVLILHGADFDLRMLRASFGYRPNKGVFDTMLAAQLLNFERFGLGALVEHFFEITLAKGSQKSNWARRPLSETQLIYAADDTRYLEDIANNLAAQLADLGRTAWHEEWSDRIVQVTETDIERDPDAIWRIKGLGSLSRRQLAFVRSLWQWRDAEARKVDRPTFKIFGNQQIIDIATQADDDITKALNGKVRLPRDCTGKRLAALNKALKEAHNLSSDDWPPRRVKRERRAPLPDTKEIVESLKNTCSVIAKDLDIQPSVLAPKATLAAIARNHVSNESDLFNDTGLMSWQIDQIQSAVVDALN